MRKLHPDKGGGAEAFHSLSTVNEFFEGPSVDTGNAKREQQEEEAAKDREQAEETAHAKAARDAAEEMADMRTVVIVGNSATRRVGPYVYTPRRAG